MSDACRLVTQMICHENEGSLQQCNPLSSGEPQDLFSNPLIEGVEYDGGDTETEMNYVRNM
jgi:hypothetical protein